MSERRADDRAASGAFSIDGSRDACVMPRDFARAHSKARILRRDAFLKRERRGGLAQQVQGALERRWASRQHGGDKKQDNEWQKHKANR
jgi:hypothetical protein